MRKLLHIVDAINERAGSISSWLVLALIIAILYEVTARYLFNDPTSWGFSTFRMLSGALVVFGWAYAQRYNSHIRVDILYTHFSFRKKAVIDIIGTGLLFLPLFGAFILQAWSQMQRAYLFYIGPYGGGLPIDLLYKIVLLIGLCLFFLQFAARFTGDIFILIMGRVESFK